MSTQNTKESEPITPRTRQATKDETIVIFWAIFKWVFCPFTITVLWEHFGEILKIEWKPTFFIDLSRTHIIEPLWRLFGEWLAYLSGFVELLKLKELFTTVEKLGQSLWNVLVSAKIFVESYTSIVTEYEWTMGSTIVGSALIFILISSIIYLLRNRIYIGWTKCMTTCRYYRLKINDMISTNKSVNKTALTTTTTTTTNTNINVNKST